MRRGTIDVKLSARPLRPNRQTTHAQDELYVVICGRGVLFHNGRRDAFEPGDCLFVAAGTGLRLGWAVIDPGRRTRAEALARQGRAVGAVALGLVLVLMVSGAIEAFVTPSGLPTWARVGIGA